MPVKIAAVKAMHILLCFFKECVHEMFFHLFQVNVLYNKKENAQHVAQTAFTLLASALHKNQTVSVM